MLLHIPILFTAKHLHKKCVGQPASPSASFQMAVLCWLSAAMPFRASISPPEILVPGADSPYLPGAGAIPFRVSVCAGTYPPQPEYSFYVPLHGAFGSLLLYSIKGDLATHSENFSWKFFVNNNMNFPFTTQYVSISCWLIATRQRKKFSRRW